jgi:hypothetical protein
MEAVTEGLLGQVNTNTAEEIEEQELDRKKMRAIAKKCTIICDKEFMLLSCSVL